jgi:putative ABC transport system permease protein
VTLRGLAAHRVRLAATALAILLGVAFMSGTLVLTATIARTFDGLWADVNQGVDTFVRSSDVVKIDIGEQRGTVDDDLVPTVAAVPGVRAVSADVSGYAQFVDKAGKALGNPVRGAPTLGFAWIDDPPLNPLRLASGAPPVGPDQVVMDKATADSAGFVVGDRVTVLTTTGSREFTLAGITRFGEVDSPLGATIAVFDLAAAQEVLGYPGRLTAISAAAEPGISPEELTARIARVLPPGLEAVTGEQVTSEQSNQTRDALSFFTTFLLVFALIALFVGSFIIYNTFSMIVAQRTREMALLRALGAGRGQVLSSVMVEAFVTGLLASLLGVAAGLGVAVLLRGLFAAVGIEIPASGLAVDLTAVAVPLAIGVLVTLLSAYVPARKAARVPPVAAMRDVALDEAGRSSRRAGIGAVLLALGVVAVAVGLLADLDDAFALVGVGVAVVFLAIAVLGPILVRPIVAVLGWPLSRFRGITGRLARENAMRNPTRTSATAAALMIGVALVGFIMIVAASASTSIRGTVDKAFAGDFVVQSNAGVFGGLTPEVAARIAALPQVAVAAEMRSGAALVDGSGIQLTAVDEPAFARITDIGVVAGDLADLTRADTIAVHRDIAEERGLVVGSTVPVVFPATGPRDLRVIAVYDQRDVTGSWLVGLRTHELNNDVQFDQFVFVALAPGVSSAEGREAIARVTDGYPNAQLQDKVEFADAVVGQVTQLLSLVYVLLLLAVLIALIGIANTLALSVFERTRELGLLRAVGMTRRQLRSTVRWEAVVIAVLGALLGVVLGAVFGWTVVTALRREGFTTLTVPYLQLVVVVVLAAAAGVLAALPPARRASRLDVLDAISSE